MLLQGELFFAWCGSGDDELDINRDPIFFMNDYVGDPDDIVDYMERRIEADNLVAQFGVQLPSWKGEIFWLGSGNEILNKVDRLICFERIKTIDIRMREEDGHELTLIEELNSLACYAWCYLNDLYDNDRAMRPWPSIANTMNNHDPRDEEGGIVTTDQQRPCDDKIEQMQPGSPVSLVAQLQHEKGSEHMSPMVQTVTPSVETIKEEVLESPTELEQRQTEAQTKTMSGSQPDPKAPNMPATSAVPAQGGMSWQKAKEQAEKHVKAHGGSFPSVKRLAKNVGCSRPTMSKAIRKSSYLKARQAESKASQSSIREEPLTDAILTKIAHPSKDKELEESEESEELEYWTADQNTDAVRDQRQARAAQYHR